MTSLSYRSINQSINQLYIISHFPAEVQILRGSSVNLCDVLSIYQLEDEAQTQVDVTEAMLNNFEREPFLELR